MSQRDLEILNAQKKQLKSSETWGVEEAEMEAKNQVLQNAQWTPALRTYQQKNSKELFKKYKDIFNDNRKIDRETALIAAHDMLELHETTDINIPQKGLDILKKYIKKHSPILPSPR